MGSFHTIGKLFILVFLLFCINFHVNSLTEEDHNLPNCNPETDNTVIPLLYNQHQAQIDKLEQLVKNLSELVSRLESKLDKSTNIDRLDDTQNFISKDKVSDRSTHKQVVEEIPDEGFNKGKKMGSGSGSGSVTKYSPLWSEKFQFMSAVNLDSIASSVNLLPFRDYEGLNKYVAVGDDEGRVYVLLRNGDVLVEYQTLSDLPVTAMLSYMSAYMNESMLVTGHSDGLILVHRLWETPVGGEDISSHVLHMENVVALDSREMGSNGVALDSREMGSNGGALDSREMGSKKGGGGGGFRISNLEVHHVRRSRYIISVDESGKMKVFRENGTLYGLAVPTSRPLAFVKQRLLFLMERGAGSLDLRSMKIRETECEGLNDSRVKNYVFDATERSKAYGYTSSGDLIHVLLLGDVMNFKCRVRSRKKLLSDMVEPLALQAIKGYLLIITQQKVYVYNVSTQHYIRSGAPPRLTFSAHVEEIKSSFLPTQMMDEHIHKPKPKTIPLIASDREKLVILGLGGGCVGMYRSKLAVSKGESNMMLWTSPVLFFLLFMFGAWQFFAKKKEALTSWGLDDDPFNSASVTSSAPLGDRDNRSFTDSSTRNTTNTNTHNTNTHTNTNNGDIMDLRSNGLRDRPSRTFASPSRYPTSTTSAAPVGASSSRPTSSVEPQNYRATSELKFRGSNIDSTGFPNRTCG